MNNYKIKLLEEKDRIEKELSKIARRNPQDPDDWQTKPENLNVMTSDPAELADVFEEAQNKEALEKELEERLNKVGAALERIENEKYGTCETCSEKIEEARLVADPAAITCIEHSRNA